MIGLIRKLFGRRGESSDGTAKAQQVEFGAVLEQAVKQSGDPRREQVARMAATGAEVGAIARDTRLARDAVRSVLGSP